MGETCNGTTHYWSDDSYDSGSYACPGPERCANARHLLKEKERTVTPVSRSTTIRIETNGTTFKFDDIKEFVAAVEREEGRPQGVTIRQNSGEDRMTTTMSVSVVPS